MAYFKWLLGGMIGAAIGGAVWVAVGYFTNYEVGYIAVLVGFLAGAGVRVAAGDHELGVGPGTAALIAAVFGVAISKYAVVAIMVNQAFGQVGPLAEALTVTDTEMMVEIADEVVGEYEIAGKAVNWPPGMTIEDATEEAHYPADVWQEAKKRYESNTPDEREALKQERQVQQEAAMQAFRKAIQQQGFLASFGMFDLLWFGLAGMTAWRAGSGLAEE